MRASREHEPTRPRGLPLPRCSRALVSSNPCCPCVLLFSFLFSRVDFFFSFFLLQQGSSFSCYCCLPICEDEIVFALQLCSILTFPDRTRQMARGLGRPSPSRWFWANGYHRADYSYTSATSAFVSTYYTHDEYKRNS